MENKLFEISDFAKISGFNRQTLIYYDKIGLLHPYKVLNNKYRMYSYSQLPKLTTIYVLKELGVPLKEIKEAIKNTSVSTSLNILESQMKNIENKINRLKLIEDLVNIRIEQIKEGIKNKDNLKIEIIHYDYDRFIYIGNDINTYHVTDENIIDFYSTAESLGIPGITSEGVIVDNINLLNKDYGKVSRMFMRLKGKAYSNKKIPKGDYLICYAKGDYGKTDYIYPYIYEYINSRNITIIGNSYEEYLIDELSSENPSEFVLKISIEVKL